MNELANEYLFIHRFAMHLLNVLHWKTAKKH